MFYCQFFYHSAVMAQGLHHHFDFFYSNAAPPTTAASPPATAQSGDSIAAAAFLVEAVLAELEVAVLVMELVLDTEVGSILDTTVISSCFFFAFHLSLKGGRLCFT